jgi:hypothetical protein
MVGEECYEKIARYGVCVRPYLHISYVNGGNADASVGSGVSV